DQWISLEPRDSKCIWTKGLDPLELPIAHGEGKFIPADDEVRRALWQNQQVALVYARSTRDASPISSYNPNGSVDDIAGICDASRLVFGLMPPPERHITRMQHPAWTEGNRGGSDAPGPGLKIFQNAVAHVAQAVGAGV